MKNPRPLIIAHRGGSPRDIDNSGAAFQHAIDVGVDMLECDLRRTRDRRLVLIHDPVIVADGQRVVIQDTAYDDLRERLPWLMTLDEFLESYGTRLPFNLDLKTHGYERDALRALRCHTIPEGTLISTVHLHSLMRLGRMADALRSRGAGRRSEIGLALSRGHLTSSWSSDLAVAWMRLTLRLMLPALLRVVQARAAMLHHGAIDAPLVERIHGSGYQVFVWTVDDERDAMRMRSIGVDGMASNDPARIIAALRTTRN